MADKLTRLAFGLALAAVATWGHATAIKLDPVPMLRVVTTHFPPYAMETGKGMPGPLAQLALETVARTGRVGKTEFVPWPRAQAMAQREHDALIIPLVRSPDREALYQWIGPLHCRRMGYVALRSHLRSFDEQTLGGASLAVLRAAPHAGSVKTRALQEATSFEDLAKLLHLGMVDVLYGNQETLALALQARGIKRAALAMSAPVESDLLWLAAAPGMPKATVGQLRQALRALAKDGSMTRILEQGGLSRGNCPTP